jgi:sulfur-oxidizing protein SoxY
MRKTGNVTAIVQDKNGKLYSASKVVKVTIGGCGG